MVILERHNYECLLNFLFLMNNLSLKKNIYKIFKIKKSVLKKQFLYKRLFPNTLASHFLLSEAQSWLTKPSVTFAAVFQDEHLTVASRKRKKARLLVPGVSKIVKPKPREQKINQAHFSGHNTCTCVCAYILASIFILVVGIEPRASFSLS